MTSEMKLSLFVILTIISLIRSQTLNRSNSPEFDWTSFLNLSPEHTHTETASIPERGAIHEEKPQEDYNEKHKDNKVIGPLTANQKKYRDWKAKHESLPALVREQQDAKAKEKHRNFREKLKITTGFSSKLNAKKAHFRSLEQSGKASSEQIEFLLNEKRKKRQQYYKKKNEICSGAVIVKRKRGRPITKVK